MCNSDDYETQDESLLTVRRDDGRYALRDPKTSVEEIVDALGWYEHESSYSEDYEYDDSPDGSDWSDYACALFAAWVGPEEVEEMRACFPERSDLLDEAVADVERQKADGINYFG